MASQDLRNLKIEVIPGINDDPQPANYLDNGRGPNGAYFTQRYNNLVDALFEELPSFEEFNLLGQAPPYLYEVGVPLILSPGNLTFTWRALSADNIEKVDLYLEDSKLNTTPLNTLEGSYEYAISNVFDTPNYLNEPGEIRWRLEGTTFRGTAFSKSILTQWKYRTIVGTSARADVLTYQDPRFNYISSQSSLFRPLSVTKPSTSRPEFLYIFLPINAPGAYLPYSGWSINGFSTFDFPSFNTSISRYGRTIDYKVYRLINATHGTFTIYLN